MGGSIVLLLIRGLFGMFGNIWILWRRSGIRFWEGYRHLWKGSRWSTGAKALRCVGAYAALKGRSSTSLPHAELHLGLAGEAPAPHLF